VLGRRNRSDPARNNDNLSALATAPAKITIKQGPSFGAVHVVYEVARSLAIDQALGSTRDGRLALWQVIARVIDQGSRLHYYIGWPLSDPLTDPIRRSEFLRLDLQIANVLGLDFGNRVRSVVVRRSRRRTSPESIHFGLGRVVLAVSGRVASRIQMASLVTSTTV
jgi:hypothetical protein